MHGGLATVRVHWVCRENPPGRFEPTSNGSSSRRTASGKTGAAGWRLFQGRKLGYIADVVAPSAEVVALTKGTASF